jgi:hypothetical protein
VGLGWRFTGRGAAARPPTACTVAFFSRLLAQCDGHRSRTLIYSCAATVVCGLRAAVPSLDSLRPPVAGYAGCLCG